MNWVIGSASSQLASSSNPSSTIGAEVRTA
jgi:hypothetical protein